MPFALIIVGLVLVVAAVRGTTDTLFSTVKGDFEGPNNFTYWVVAILILGALGYVPSLEKISRLFLALVVVALFLSNGGFFEKFNQQAFGSSPADTSLGSLGSLSGALSNLATPQPWASQNQTFPGIESPIISPRISQQ